MKAYIIVGAGFGDEGKGLTTDYLCSLYPDAVVVRYCGGQQAGHTVMLDGKKHIFASYGSGSLRGLPSYISEYCTFYPPNIVNERIVLKRKGIAPVLSIHPLAKLTTPYDIAFNRITEKTNNHGSCGKGIGATMKRMETPYKIYAVDLLNSDILAKKLQMVGVYYRELLSTIPSQFTSQRDKDFSKIVDEEHDNFWGIVSRYNFNITGYSYLQEHEDIIFEGAQGIMLDMGHGMFPNVTYGHTTTKNALEMCNKLGIDREDIEIWYVTRCYQTRHGSGWMSSVDKVELSNTAEEINSYNEWQTNFRTAELDISLLNYALECDDAYSYGCKKNLVVTCLDQREGYIFPYDQLSYKFDNIYESYSPYSNQIKKLKHATV